MKIYSFWGGRESRGNSFTEARNSFEEKSLNFGQNFWGGSIEVPLSNTWEFSDSLSTLRNSIGISTDSIQFSGIHFWDFGFLFNRNAFLFSLFFFTEIFHVLFSDQSSYGPNSSPMMSPTTTTTTVQGLYYSINITKCQAIY